MNNKHIEELLDQALKEYEELEERINKALEYIKDHDIREDKTLRLFIFEKKELINILKGGKENE